MCVCVGGVRSDGEGKIFLTKNEPEGCWAKKYLRAQLRNKFWKFNETLTNNVISFDQPGPVL